MTGQPAPLRIRSAPMRVALLVTRSDVFGGAVVHVRDLARGLAREGHDVRVFIGGDGPMVDHLRGAGLHVTTLRHLVRNINPAADARAVRELIGTLGDHVPDLVHGHTAKAGLLARMAARRLRVPAVYTPHAWPFMDGVPPAARAVYLQIERAAARLPASIINVCDYERAHAMDAGVGAHDQHHVVHNGVADVPSELRASPTGGTPHLVVAARFEPQKDHVTLVRALAGIADTDWRCTLLGDGRTRPQVRRLVERLGLARRVDMPGEVDDVVERLAQSHAVVLPSRWEALPLVLLEAMRAGLPTVATDVGGVREAVRNAETGLLVRRGDVGSLADGLRTLVQRHDLRAGMGAAARLRYERHFTLQEMVRRTIAVYEAAIVRQRRPDLVRQPLRRTRAATDHHRGAPTDVSIDLTESRRRLDRVHAGADR